VVLLILRRPGNRLQGPGLVGHQAYRPRPRPMISFVISGVPPSAR